METRGLLFIPDISGFSKFIAQTEIDHSRLIIQELLEILINANNIGLQISEIEGDAILFYKFGEAPAIDDLYRQVEKMFCEFHEAIVSYEALRFCQCDACKSAIDLTLKVISHYGEFTEYQVRDFHKLIGKDLVVAHQLLKNDIEKHEYWLVTRSLSQSPSTIENLQWLQGSRDTEAGQISYNYIPLSPLKDKVQPRRQTDVDTSKSRKIISLSERYKTDIITLLHATGDFRYRNRWQDGVKSTIEESHFLPRVGMKCRCVLETGEYYIFSTSYKFSEELITFTETNQTTGNITTYELRDLKQGDVLLTIEIYAPNGWLATLLRWFKKKDIESSVKRSMANLQKFAIELSAKRKEIELG